MTPDQILALALAFTLLTTTLTALAWDVWQDRRIERRRIEAEQRRRLDRRIRMIAQMGDGSRPEPGMIVYREGR